MDKNALRVERFRLLMDQFHKEREKKRGWQADFARAIGKTPAAVSQFWTQGINPEADTIAEAAKAFSLPIEFFTDPSLGKPPNYRDYVGKRFLSASATIGAKATATATVTHVERDPIDESSMDQWTVFKHTDEYKRASEEAKAEALKLRNLDLNLSVGQYIKFVENKDAEARGKAVHEPKQDTPIAENHMPLKPGRKGR